MKETLAIALAVATLAIGLILGIWARGIYDDWNLSHPLYYGSDCGDPVKAAQLAPGTIYAPEGCTLTAAWMNAWWTARMDFAKKHGLR